MQKPQKKQKAVVKETVKPPVEVKSTPPPKQEEPQPPKKQPKPEPKPPQKEQPQIQEETKADFVPNYEESDYMKEWRALPKAKKDRMTKK